MAKTKKTPTEVPKGLLLQVPVQSIRTTGTNPRKYFNDEDIEELAMSIKTIGLMQPVVCMKADDDFVFTLICGERRYRAAIKAGLTHIPGMVYDPLPEEVVFEMQITENLQRKDINPMEESNAFAELVKRGLKTAEQIADKLGVSTKYIYDRLALQKVIPEVQERIEAGDLSISHGKQFARISKDDQEKLWSSVSANPSVTLATIKDLISRTFTKKLSEAIFSITDPLLYKKAGACTNCPKRSGCNQLLFDDIHQDDICFDQQCYDQKVFIHLEELEESLKKEGKKVIRISADWRHQVKASLSRNKWEEVEKGKPFDFYGLIVEPSPYDSKYPLGKVIQITIEKEEEELEDDDNDVLEGGTAVRRETSSPARKEIIDWDNVLGERLEKQVINFFLCNPTKKIRSVLIDEFVSAFNMLNNEAAVEIAERLGWELIEQKDNRWQPYDLRKTAIKAVEDNDYSNALLIDFKHMFDVISSLDESITYDYKDFSKAEGRLFEMGINLREEIQAINTEAGKEEIEIPEPESVEEEE